MSVMRGGRSFKLQSVTLIGGSRYVLLTFSSLLCPFDVGSPMRSISIYRTLSFPGSRIARNIFEYASNAFTLLSRVASKNERRIRILSWLDVV